MHQSTERLVCEAVVLCRGFASRPGRMVLGAASYELALPAIPGRLPKDMHVVAVLRGKPRNPLALGIRVFHQQSPRPVHESDAFSDAPIQAEGKLFLATSFADVVVTRAGEYRVELREGDAFLGSTKFRISGEWASGRTPTSSSMMLG